MPSASAPGSERRRDGIPDGFAPLFRTSPFLEATGPYYYRRDGERLIVGLRILEKHVNARGIAHGGLLLTLADIALGYSVAFRESPPAALITANLSADFAGSARIGDWVEAHVDIQKVDGERILRVSAVFARNSGEPPGGRPAESAHGRPD